ncbi:hypothetical protein [Chryseobacterium ginsenosidimutans]|uniref:hypothetical protein n=1 Tax=Chryseobacterium ginsenosidimutans TaxID=687846 RepID=UPI0027B9F1D2|nr:hypothetical protein [Chryseobacterium ginsenosidimutans]
MMRKNISWLFLLTVFGCMLQSCRNEDLYLGTENDKPSYSGITSKTLHRRDIDRVPSLSQTLQSVTYTGKNSSAKIYTDDKEGFTVNTEEFMLVEDNTGMKCYTFRVQREQENDLLENLLVTDKGDGSLYTYLVQYNQEYQKGRFSSAPEMRDLIEKNLKIIPLGIKKEGEIFGKIASNVCMGVTTVWVEEPGTNCESGDHTFMDGDACIYWEHLGMALPGVGGHYVYTMYDNCSTQGSGGSVGTVGTTGPYVGGSIGDIYIYPPDPCEALKDLYKPAKTNIKPAITYLQGKLGETVEFGKTLIKYPNPTPNTSPDVYENQENTQSTNTEVFTGRGGPVYGSIHTHYYPGLVPMFSWKDMKALYQYYSETNDENIDKVVMVLVCKDDNGQNQVYAIKIDDPNTLYDALQNDAIQNIPDLAGMTSVNIAKIMDDDLTKLYTKNYPEREKTFLDRFANFGISLYKADENVTTWDKLIIENGIVTPKPCN